MSVDCGNNYRKSFLFILIISKNFYLKKNIKIKNFTIFKKVLQLANFLGSNKNINYFS